MLRKLYDWTLKQAEHKYALALLAFISFIESSVFPITPLVILGPMILARPDRAWLIAGVCTIASVAGGLFGYLIGMWFFDLIGTPVLEFYNYAEKFEAFRGKYNEYGAWAVLMAGITPFPYKVITIVSGATGLNLVVFTLASIVARAIQFFLVAGILWYFGPPARKFIEKRLGLVVTIAFITLIGGIFALKLF